MANSNLQEILNVLNSNRAKHSFKVENYFESPRFSATRILKVEDVDVYLGSLDDAMNNEALSELNITCTIDCASAQSEQALKLQGKTHIVRQQNDSLIRFNIPAEDHPRYKIAQHFDEVSSYIDLGIRENRNILIHCMQGLNRSATLLAAWLVKARAFTLLDAIDLISGLRPGVFSNKGFLRELVNEFVREKGKSQLVDAAEDETGNAPAPMRNRRVIVGDIKLKVLNAKE
jgi:atypical dual specificity phosphatase